LLTLDKLLLLGIVPMLYIISSLLLIDVSVGPIEGIYEATW